MISQGRPEAARELLEAVSPGAETFDVLVERAPYAVSAAYGVATVPTLVLLDAQGRERDRCEGWDRPATERLLAAVGGRLGAQADALPEHKPGCQSRNTLSLQIQEQTERDDAELGGDGVDELWRRGWTDGLPVVPPTRTRVAAMVSERDPGAVLGRVPPIMATLTVERLAVCAVLAGCEPAFFPVVLAATQAVLDPVFNLHGIQNTTHFAAPVLVVNGPARTELGLGSGSNALGFGNRANATIGRALRLMMCLTGGGESGVLDMSTLGGPHKFGLCFAEHEEASPWEPLHVELGFTADRSTVTAIGGESPAGFSDHTSETAEALATTMTLAMEQVWSPCYYPVGAAQTLLIVCPEHARSLADARWSKDRLRQWIFSHARRSAGALRASGSGELSRETLAASDEESIGKFCTPEEILIVVAGGSAGRFSAVIPPVGLSSAMVTRTIDLPA